MGLNFSRHEPGRYGAMSSDSKRRYVITKSESGYWTAESYVMVKGHGPTMNMSYGGFTTMKGAQFQCEDWDRSRMLRKERENVIPIFDRRA